MARDPEIERAVSAALAEQALANKEDLGEDLSNAFTNIGKSITDAISSGLTAVKQGTEDVRDELKDVGETIDEKMDEVVGFIVDPIRKALYSVAKDISGDLDPAMAAGFVVGAVVSLGDEIAEGWKWLWNNWDVALEELGGFIMDGLKAGWELVKTVAPYVLEGLVKLGDVILGGLEMGWEFFKDTVVPGIVDGVTALGQLIWDYTPDWIQTGIKAIHSVVKGVMSLGANLLSGISDAIEWGLRKIGLDTAADVLMAFGDLLGDIAWWLGAEKSERQTAEEKAAALQHTTSESIAASGSAEAKAVFKEVEATGLGSYRAAGLASLVDTDASAAKEAMKAFRGALASGTAAKDAYGIAFEAFRVAQKGGGASATPLGSAAAGGDIKGMIADEASSIVATREANDTLKRMVSLQEQAVRDQGKEGSAPNVMDTVSSADELTVFSTGRMGGGMT